MISESVKKDFLTILKSKVLIADGAMGTMLYSKGVFVNSCFEEMNLTAPDLVKQVHSDYLAAGSDFIETNTFGANEIKLGKFALAEKTEMINKAAIEIAKSASEKYSTFIAGSIGPTGLDITAFQSNSTEAGKIAFANQVKYLRDGVDFLIFETFSNIHELCLAVEVASGNTDLPIVAQMTTAEIATEDMAEILSIAFERLQSIENICAVGLNCSTGPAEMLDALEIIKKVTDKPIVLQPNAGAPQNVDGRQIYMSSPEYMTEYAKRFYEKGVKIIGGCCGTTPEHIRQIARAVGAIQKSHSKQHQKTSVKIEHTSRKKIQSVKLENKSKLGEHLANGKKIFTIEISPPAGTDLTVILDKVQLCCRHGIDFVNIPDGPRASSRISPTITAIRIAQETDAEPILHFCCRDRNLIGMQSDLLGLEAIGLKNVLAITGDPPKLGNFPEATAVFDIDSVSLVRIISNLNYGTDISGADLHKPLSLTVGVGANPAASDLKREIERFRKKVENGAEYAITQPVFDVSALERFLDAVKDTPIPIIAGIWPFTSFKNAEFMANEVPGVVVPKDLLDEMASVKNADDAKKRGIEIARRIIEKIDPLVQGFAVSAPFGNVKIALSVLGKIQFN